MNKDVKQNILFEIESYTEDAPNAAEIQETWSRIKDIGSKLNRSGLYWYFTGGLAIDLRANRISRKHSDYDVVVLRDDLEGWISLLSTLDLKLTRDDKVLSLEEARVLNNVWLKSDDHTNPLDELEIVIMDTSEGRLIYSKEPMFLHDFLDSQPKKDIDGVEVRYGQLLTRMIYKLANGRLKDFTDLLLGYQLLTPTEKVDWTKYTDESFEGFKLTDTETILKVDDLMKQRFDIDLVKKKILKSNEMMERIEGQILGAEGAVKEVVAQRIKSYRLWTSLLKN